MIGKVYEGDVRPDNGLAAACVGQPERPGPFSGSPERVRRVTDIPRRPVYGPRRGKEGISSRFRRPGKPGWKENSYPSDRQKGGRALPPIRILETGTRSGYASFGIGKGELEMGPLQSEQKSDFL